MRVVVETPKGSFTKYRLEDGVFKPELKTPFPTLFNYGFIEGQMSGDGQARDAIVIGPRLPQGAAVECKQLGRVLFTDDGMEDDKMVAKPRGDLTYADAASIHIFFTAYMLYKTLRYLFSEHKLACSLYRGLRKEM